MRIIDFKGVEGFKRGIEVSKIEMEQRIEREIAEEERNKAVERCNRSQNKFYIDFAYVMGIIIYVMCVVNAIYIDKTENGFLFLLLMSVVMLPVLIAYTAIIIKEIISDLFI